MSNIIVFCALESEFALPRPHKNIDVIYTGVGKLNAAFSAMRGIERLKPSLAINYGSAGAVDRALHGLIECGSAVQRDYDLSPLGIPVGAHIGDSSPHIIRWNDLDIRVGTGDQFSTEPPQVECDLVDMESYALAAACQALDVRFRCFKYVSDYADSDAADSWEENQSKGAALFYQRLLQIHQNG